jgi:hypothetical protein
LDGDNIPSLTDHTDFDSITTLTKTRTFKIHNSGVAALGVSTITLSGTHASLYSIGGITLPTTIAASGSTTFTVTFSPTSPGAKVATVTITNSDCDEGSYDFSLNGNINCTNGSASHSYDKNNASQYTGSEGSIFFIGYGPRADTLKATGFAGAITWTPSNYLNCATCPKTIFTPTDASVGQHTITVSNGCVSKKVQFCVRDQRDGTTKMFICYNANTFSVAKTSRASSLNSTYPGYKLGACADLTCTVSKGNNATIYKTVVDEEELQVMCFPNPFSHSFNLNYASSSDKDAHISIYGITGNLIDQVTLSGFQNEAQLGENLPNGIYTISFVQGNKIRVFKMIKVNR